MLGWGSILYIYTESYLRVLEKGIWIPVQYSIHLILWNKKWSYEIITEVANLFKWIKR